MEVEFKCSRQRRTTCMGDVTDRQTGVRPKIPMRDPRTLHNPNGRDQPSLPFDRRLARPLAVPPPGIYLHRTTFVFCFAHREEFLLREGASLDCIYGWLIVRRVNLKRERALCLGGQGRTGSGTKGDTHSLSATNVRTRRRFLYKYTDIRTLHFEFYLLAEKVHMTRT